VTGIQVPSNKGDCTLPREIIVKEKKPNDFFLDLLQNY
jgi:hypothetical protein